MKPVTIRTATLADVDDLLAIYAPYVRDTAVTFEYDVPSAEEFTQRLRHTLQRYPYLVALCDGQVVGYAYAGPFKGRAAYDWSCETTIYLAGNERRQGIGSALYDALEQALAQQGILNLYACIAYPCAEDAHLTLDSVRFHAKRGFREVGRFRSCGYKFDTWYDMVWMEKFIGSHVSPQPAPRWPAPAFP